MHKAVNLNETFLLIGGKDSDAYLNDVWTSTNGVTWTQIRPNGYPEVAPRYSHTGVTLGGQLGIIAGEGGSGPYGTIMFDDAWHSADGVNWDMDPNSLPDAKTGHSSVVFQPEGETNERAYVIAGLYGVQQMPTNDVYSFAVGSGWRKDWDAGSPVFSQRYNTAASVFKDPADQKDKIWVIGGSNGYQSFNSEVWASANGWDWKDVTDGGMNLIQPSRELSCAMSFDGGMWVIGGSTSGDVGPFYFNDVWYSANGRDWQKTADDTARFTARSGHACTVFDNNMWVIGGMGVEVGYEVRHNDAWYSSDGTNWTEYCGSGTCEFAP